MNIKWILLGIIGALAVTALVVGAIIISQPSPGEAETEDCRGPQGPCPQGSNDCCNGLNCEQNQCCLPKDQGPCVFGDDCCGNLYCREGRCTDCKLLSEACAPEDACCEGECQDGVCRRQCSQDGDCPAAAEECYDGFCYPCSTEGTQATSTIIGCCQGLYKDSQGVCRRARTLGQTCEEGSDTAKCGDGLACVDGECVCYDLKETKDASGCCSGSVWDNRCCQVEGMFCQNTADCCGDWMQCLNGRCTNNTIRYNEPVTIQNIRGYVLRVNSNDAVEVSYNGSLSDQRSQWRFIDPQNPWSAAVVDLSKPVCIRSVYNHRSNLSARSSISQFVKKVDSGTISGTSTYRYDIGHMLTLVPENN